MDEAAIKKKNEKEKMKEEKKTIEILEFSTRQSNDKLGLLHKRQPEIMKEEIHKTIRLKILERNAKKKNINGVIKLKKKIHEIISR